MDSILFMSCLRNMKTLNMRETEQNEFVFGLQNDKQLKYVDKRCKIVRKGLRNVV